MTEAQRLSRLLFEAREALDMFADVMRSRTGQEPADLLRTRDELDAYRAEQGWNPDGFGGE